jgi:hypothetical protein
MSKKSVKKNKSQVQDSRPFGNRWLKYLLPLVIFIWPFLYLFPLIAAVKGSYRAIGNDFIYYYKFKLYLLANLVNLHIPFWSPSEAAGYPFASSPFAQVFYPLNVPLVVFYKLAGGYSWTDHQIFTVFAVAIFALGLFAWLRLINSNLRAVIFATVIMSVSFKVTEILRFTTAVHTAAWYPWILYAITRIMLNTSIKDAVLSGAYLIFFVFCQCSGAYPYYFYYGQFLFIPYFLIYFIKPLRIRLFGDQPIYFKRALVTIAIAGIAAVLICSPYLLALKNLMSETTDRGGKNFNFSVSHVFGWQDTVGSLIYPPASQVEGWYFFGITALLIILLSLCHVVRKDSSGESELQPQYFNDYWGRIFFLLWFGTISYITYGAASYLFKFLWNYWPGFSGLRVWGRLNIILVPIFAWLLSFAYASYESLLSSTKTETPQKIWKKWMPIGMAVICYGVILIAQCCFFIKKIYNPQWLTYFTNVASNDILFIIYGIAAFTVVMIPLVISRWVPVTSNAALTLILIALAAVNIFEMRHVGTNMWTHAVAAQQDTRIRLDIAQINKESFFYRRVENRGMITLEPAFNVGIIENWYFNRYISFLKNTENELAPRQFLLGMHDGRRIFFSQAIEHPTVQAFLQDAMRYPQTGRLLSYTGDELQWEINAPLEGYLSFIDNWDPSWRAFVDEKPADIKLLFGTFKSVKLTPGLHRVRFEYQPNILLPLKSSNFDTDHKK